MSDVGCRRALVLAVGLVLGSAPGPTRPAHADPYTIRYRPGIGDAPAAIVVAGIAPDALAALAEVRWSPARWSGLLAVMIVPGPRSGPGAVGLDPPAIVGSYRVAGPLLEFRPRYPIEAGLRHRVRFRPSRLPLAGGGGGGDVVTEFTRPLGEPPTPATVVRVDPTGDLLPENLLKFYLHFSRPMSRGEAYRRVHLRSADGRVVERPFLELGEELWDRPGTRLTLLLDPGRIKRGLKPREEEGPILESGRAYTLEIDGDWPDAEGYPLRATHRKPFRAGPADEAQPDPRTWSVSPPAAGTLAPLSLSFAEPLDRAMLERVLAVRGAGGGAIAGRVEVDAGETRWRFVPARPWAAGGYEVVVDSALEDRAGNSIARPFEVDRPGPTVRADAIAETVTVPFTIR